MSKEKFKRKKRRAAAAAAALALAVSVTFPAGTDMSGISFGNAIVASAEESGTCGDGVTWTFDDVEGKLTISYTGSGSGAMDNWGGSNKAPWYNSYSGSIKNVVIGQGVTSIGNYAFYGCSSIESISIEDSVTSIGEAAFNRSSLKSITIPNSVTSIGKDAFLNCTSLTSINVNEDNQNYCSVDGILFNKDKTTLIAYPTNKSGASYVIPDSVTSIGKGAFWNCTSLTSITIPDSVTSIGGYAFNNCTSLKSITIPNNATSIESYAFAYCSNLTSVTILNNATSIEDYAFYFCSRLTSIFLPEHLTSIGTEAIPRSATQIKYTVADGKVTVTGVTLGIGQTSVSIPSTIYGKTVTAVFIENGTTVTAPDTAAQVKYTVSDNKVTITEMTNVSAGQKVDIPEKISGYPVVSVATAYQQYVGNHTHYFSNNICGLCSGEEYVTGITVSPDTLSVTVGDPASQLTAAVVPANAVDTSVEWTSSDTSVATVDDSGNVTAVGKGTATITATAKDGSGIYGECAVTVFELIGSVDIVIAEPTSGSALAANASVSTTGVKTTAPTIYWTGEKDTNGNAKYNTEYTASVTLEPDTGYKFASNVTANIKTSADGLTVGTGTVTSSTTDDTITVSYLFDPTEQDTVKPPTASPLSGTYTENQSVELSCTTQGAAIYYTTDGTDPTTGSTQYTGPISVTGTAGQSVTTTIKAIAVKDGMQDSAAATFTYTIEIPAVTHTITATAVAGGSISPSGSVTVADNDSQTFTITPDSGYEIDTLTVDNVVVTATTSYTFTNVTDNHTISVTFTQSHTHSYGTEWKTDSTSHWHECSCGDKADIGKHISDGGKVTKQAASYCEGEITYSCKVCGKVLKTEIIPMKVDPIVMGSFCNSYIYSYDSDMNRITVNRTRKQGTITVDLGKEYAGKSFVLYEGRKSTKVKVTEGTLDKNGKFTLEVENGKNYTLVIE